jgi:hypothetical protein
MKKQAFRVLTILGLFVIMSAASVYAQSVKSSFVVEIPFEFVAADKTLPAGKYNIRPISTAEPNLLSLQNVDSGAITTVMGQSLQASKVQADSKLVFTRYGDRYFLSKVWTFGSYRGRELPRSRDEIELAKGASKSQMVSLTAPRK